MQDHIPTFPAGWKVFPLHAGTKKPIFEAWQDAASADPEVHADWAMCYPDCNWAVAAGPSGLAMLDLDGGVVGEASLLDFELAEGALPDTREHRSARGGRHLIFSDPKRTLRNSASRLGPKLDTRGGNGYIVIPPSTFEGGTYEVLHNRPVADLPEFVVAALGRARERATAAADVQLDTPSAIGRAGVLLSGYVERGHVAVEGQGGDDRTYAVCAEVLNLGLSADKAQELVSTLWNPHCIPPWSEEELAVKIDNASAYAQNEVGAWAVPPVVDRIGKEALDQLLADSMTQREERTEGGRFAWMDEDEFTHMEPPIWLLKDIFTRDSIAMLYGPSGHYKSFIAMNLAAEVAQAGECAFYVAAEGIARMARKDYPAWKMAYAEERKLPFYLVEDMPLADQPEDYTAFADSIRAKAAGRPVGIIFIDTLNRAMLGLEENSAKDTAKVIQACLFLKKVFRCTVVVVHHTPKDGSDPRGSSALYAGFDTVLKVIADKAVKLARMFVTKQKTDEERAFPFCYEGRKFGSGLAFVPVDAKAAALLSDEANIFSQKNISATLKAMKAFEPTYVSSHALLKSLVPALENETEQARADSLARAAKGLYAAVKTRKLEGYHSGLGKDLRWSLLSQDEA